MKAKLSLVLLALCFTVAALAAPPAATEGKTIFSSRCAMCHSLNKVLTGPALAGVDQRHTIDWIVKFVHSSQTVVKSGDTAAVGLFTRFNKIVMPDHPDLTDDNIKSVVEYIKAEGGKKEDADKPKTETPAKPAFTIGKGDALILGAVFALLIAVILFRAQVKKYAASNKNQA